MRLLVLGGTRFVGRAIVSAAVDAEWEVTTFNRGQSGPPIDGVRTIYGDRTHPERIARLADAGPWDAVVDTSGYVPRNVLTVAETLQDCAARYLFMSTVSVYAAGQSTCSRRLPPFSNVLRMRTEISARTSRTDQQNTATKSQGAKPPSG